MKEIKQFGHVTDSHPISRLQRMAFIVAIIGLLLWMIGFHLALAARGWSNYRDQHLGAALDYAKGRIDLLHPIIVGFNAGDTPTPQELPLWQGTLAGHGGGVLQTVRIVVGLGKLHVAIVRRSLLLADVSPRARLRRRAGGVVDADLSPDPAFVLLSPGAAAPPAHDLTRFQTPIYGGPPVE